jgi:hypothetical protein
VWLFVIFVAAAIAVAGFVIAVVTTIMSAITVIGELDLICLACESRANGKHGKQD